MLKYIKKTEWLGVWSPSQVLLNFLRRLVATRWGEMRSNFIWIFLLRLVTIPPVPAPLLFSPPHPTYHLRMAFLSCAHSSVPPGVASAAAPSHPLPLTPHPTYRGDLCKRRSVKVDFQALEKYTEIAMSWLIFVVGKTKSGSINQLENTIKFIFSLFDAHIHLDMITNKYVSLTKQTQWEPEIVYMSMSEWSRYHVVSAKIWKVELRIVRFLVRTGYL